MQIMDNNDNDDDDDDDNISSLLPFEIYEQHQS